MDELLKELCEEAGLDPAEYRIAEADEYSSVWDVTSLFNE
jgi:hypothetical protein